MLTEAMLREAFDRLANQPMRACGVTEPHVLYPQQAATDGWHVCGNCGSPVEIADGRVKGG